MKVWLQSVRGMRWLAVAGFFVVLAVAVSRGQTVLLEYGEPPMVDTPRAASPSAPPTSPFAPPPPTPLPPEQAVPMVPAMPTPFAEGLEPPMPAVRLHVRAPARVEPDKEIEYRLTVVNVSNAAAHHVLVRDRLPRGVDKYVRAEPKCDKTQTKDGLTDLLWELGTLRAGAHKEIVLTIKPKGTKDIENRAYVQFEHGQKVTTRIAKADETPALRSLGVSPSKPSVRVQVIAPAHAILYQSIPLRIEVTNKGALPLRNVVVTEELPDGLELGAAIQPQPKSEKPLTWEIRDLAPHQVRRIECEVISTKGGKFTTQARATAEGGATATDSAAVTVGEMKLKISISGPQRRLANRPIPYHITVSNLGTMAVTNVQVSDELPRDIQFVSVDERGRKEGYFVRWSLGKLRPGEQRSLFLVLSAPMPPGRLLNQVTVQADNNLSDKARSETHIDAASTPVIEIDKQTDWLAVGQKATYTIRLLNPGKKNVLHPRVFIKVPDEMRIRGQRGPTPGQQREQQIHFDPLPVINSGKEERFFVEVEAQTAGVANLRAWWTEGFQEPRTPEIWEDKTIVLDPARPASRAASQAQNLQARILLWALKQHVLGVLARPRSPCWTCADTLPAIP